MCIEFCFFHRLTGSADQTNQSYVRKPTQNGASANGLPRANIAAVEPYNHVPLPNGHQNRNLQTNQEVSKF